MCASTHPNSVTRKLAWRERTAQQSTKAMETTKVVKTRTVIARVKAVVFYVSIDGHFYGSLSFR